MWKEGTRLAVIADDLTGSCDTAAQFSRFGLKNLVSHRPALAAQRPEPIIVVNTDSRKLRTAAAMRSASEVARQLMACDRGVVYKKIDSTLKGSWVSEVIGLFKTTRPSLVLIAPAFPEWGRTTVDGVQLLHGIPVSESGLARRKTRSTLEAEAGSDIINLLQEQLGRRVPLINASITHKGPRRIEQAIDSARSRGERFIVFDAASDNDLKNICLGGCRLEDKLLWVGSAGLARFLPLGWGLRPVSRPLLTARSGKPTLLINGSLHPGNGPQLELLTESWTIHCLILEDDDQASMPETQRKLNQASKALQDGIDTVMSLRLNRGIQSLTQLERLHSVLQWCSSQLIRLGLVGGTVIVGGETAAKIYREVGAEGIHVEGEVHPGVPIGAWAGGLLDKQPIITKAGGFGRNDTLLRALEYLRDGKLSG